MSTNIWVDHLLNFQLRCAWSNNKQLSKWNRGWLRLVTNIIETYGEVPESFLGSLESFSKETSLMKSISVFHFQKCLLFHHAVLSQTPYTEMVHSEICAHAIFDSSGSRWLPSSVRFEITSPSPPVTRESSTPRSHSNTRFAIPRDRILEQTTHQRTRFEWQQLSFHSSAAVRANHSGPKWLLTRVVFPAPRNPETINPMVFSQVQSTIRVVEKSLSMSASQEVDGQRFCTLLFLFLLILLVLCLWIFYKREVDLLVGTF